MDRLALFLVIFYSVELLFLAQLFVFLSSSCWIISRIIGMPAECGRNAQQIVSYRDIPTGCRKPICMAPIELPVGECSVKEIPILLPPARDRPRNRGFPQPGCNFATFLQQVHKTIEFGPSLPWKRPMVLANWRYRKSRSTDFRARGKA